VKGEEKELSAMRRIGKFVQGTASAGQPPAFLHVQMKV
jgi:hypothetical protein